MSRIGKLPVVLPEKVQAKVSWNEIEVSGALGTLKISFSPLVQVSVNENQVTVNPLDLEDPLSKALWGTTRANINNMVVWVSAWYTKSLEINWVWYKFEVAGSDKLVLNIGYSHKVDVQAPKWITLKQDEKAKNVIYISWIDKQLVWEFASKIRAMKKPEPYKWKWIKYVWENIRRKAWKSGK